MTGPLVSSSWLLEHLADGELLVVDTRFALGKPDAGRTAFEAGHLPGAVFADLERDLSATVRPEMIVDAVGVAARAGSTVLVDSRAPERYRGDVEPLDWKAGHIPGAININWSDGLREGRWKPAEEQKDRFPAADATIVYCGSGVSAAGNLLAMELAGIENVKLYPGSWSDWISDPGRPIVTSPPD